MDYTITVTDSGQTPYTGATFTDPLTGVLANAAYNADASRDRRHRVLRQPDLTWTGNLAVGAAATITYSVTVDDPDTGDRSWPTPSPRPRRAATARPGAPILGAR